MVAILGLKKYFFFFYLIKMNFTNKEKILLVILAFLLYKIFFSKEGFENTKYDCSKHMFDCSSNKGAIEKGCVTNPNPQTNALGDINPNTYCMCSKPELCKDKLSQVLSGSVKANATTLADELIKIQDDYIIKIANPNISKRYNSYLDIENKLNETIKQLPNVEMRTNPNYAQLYIQKDNLQIEYDKQLKEFIDYYNINYSPLFNEGIDSGFDSEGKPNNMKRGDIRSKNADKIFMILGVDYKNKYINYVQLTNQSY
jgi:hypothetical protein